MQPTGKINRPAGPEGEGRGLVLGHLIRTEDRLVGPPAGCANLVHMIEEHARHAGHTDLLRERIDGRIGQ